MARLRGALSSLDGSVGSKALKPRQKSKVRRRGSKRAGYGQRPKQFLAAAKAHPKASLEEIGVSTGQARVLAAPGIQRPIAPDRRRRLLRAPPRRPDRPGQAASAHPLFPLRPGQLRGQTHIRKTTTWASGAEFACVESGDRPLIRGQCTYLNQMVHSLVSDLPSLPRHEVPDLQQ